MAFSPSHTFYLLIASYLYVIFFEKMADVMFRGQPRCQRNSNRFVFLFVLGMVGFFGARTYSHQHPKMNPILRDGLSLGGILLSARITLSYWHQMNDQMKLLVVGFGFGSYLMYLHLHPPSSDLHPSSRQKDGSKKKQK